MALGCSLTYAFLAPCAWILECKMAGNVSVQYLLNPLSELFRDACRPVLLFGEGCPTEFSTCLCQGPGSLVVRE